MFNSFRPPLLIFGAILTLSSNIAMAASVVHLDPIASAGKRAERARAARVRFAEFIERVRLLEQPRDLLGREPYNSWYFGNIFTVEPKLYLFKKNGDQPAQSPWQLATDRLNDAIVKAQTGSVAELEAEADLIKKILVVAGTLRRNGRPQNWLIRGIDRDQAPQNSVLLSKIDEVLDALRQLAVSAEHAQVKSSAETEIGEFMLMKAAIANASALDEKVVQVATVPNLHDPDRILEAKAPFFRNLFTVNPALYRAIGQPVPAQSTWDQNLGILRAGLEAASPEHDFRFTYRYWNTMPGIMRMIEGTLNAAIENNKHFTGVGQEELRDTLIPRIIEWHGLVTEQVRLLRRLQASDPSITIEGMSLERLIGLLKYHYADIAPRLARDLESEIPLEIEIR